MRRLIIGQLGRPRAGQPLEHVVERWLMHRHVLQFDTGFVERPNYARHEAGGGAHRRAKVPPILADPERTVDKRAQGADRGGVGCHQRYFESCTAGHALQFGRRALGHDAATIDHDDAVRKLVRFVQVLRRQEHCHAVFDQIADHRPDAEAAGRVKPGRWFIQEQHRRAGHQARREVETPPHAAGVALQDSVGGVRELEGTQQFLRSCPRVAPLHPAQLADHVQVLPPGEHLVQGGGLRRDADVPAHRGRVADHVEPGDPGMTGIRQRERRQDAHGCRLARPIGAEHTKDCARAHSQIDAGQRLGRAKPFRETLGLKHVLRHSCSLFPVIALLLSNYHPVSK